jgi:hypothetical protein
VERGHKKDERDFKGHQKQAQGGGIHGCDEV